MDMIEERTLRDLLKERVQQHPDKILFAFEDAKRQITEKTYAEFEKEIEQLSYYLISIGIQPRDYVTLHLPNNLEFYTIWFALANIGAVMVPTNVLSTAEEMKYVIEHSRSVMVITEAPYAKKIEQAAEGCEVLRHKMLTRSGSYKDYLSYEKALSFESACISELPALHSEDTVAVLYTSGTTSKPKGVCVTHTNYIYAGESMALNLQITPDDRVFIVLPLFHGNAQYYTTLPALTVGASIALTEKFSATRYFEQSKLLGATLGSLFAAPIRMILAKHAHADQAESPLHTIIFAQSVTNEQLKRFEQLSGAKLSQLYGMTETIGVPLMNPLHSTRNNLSIGKPTPGYEVRLVDEDGNDVPAGVSGQILVKGVPGQTIMKEYLNNPEATRETIRDGWLHTGDNAEIGEDGWIYFTDRVKDMIKRSGENVATIEVESALSLHPAVYETAVIGVPDDMRDEAIKAFVILKEGHSATEEILLAHCRELLAKFKVPDSIEFMEDFPRTSVGKIQKHKLKNIQTVK